MRIQEQMVKLLNEHSWDDVVRNYPDSSSTSMLKDLYLAFKKLCSFIHSFIFICILFLFYNLCIYLFILLKMKKDANGAPDSFRSFIEKIKMEMMRKKRLSNVELDPSISHFIWNGFHTIQYQIIPGDCEDIAKLVPKIYYSLVIAVPHGFNIPEVEYDSDPYSYQTFSKVVAGFLEVTTSPFWIFVTFHSKVKDATYMLDV